jgi:hypothetical protein
MLSARWTRARHAWALFAVIALAYPLAVLAGGGPHFPSKRDCAVPARHDGNITLVLGSFASMTAAAPLLERVRREGYVEAEAMTDGCGGVLVAVRGYSTLASAENAAAEARRAGLRARLYQG